jgi:formiminotetrahydrofolate cyclodeaminase/Zn-dependent peptidase ImmA (M78 family)
MAGRLLDLSVSMLLAKFGAGSHKPGSGSAAAFQGLLAAQLIKTVIELTNEPKRRKQYSQHLQGMLQIESELNKRVIPTLERLFEEDSLQFDKAIKARERRDAEDEPRAKRRLAEEARNLLIPGVDIPLRIAKECVDLANFAITTFDHGFASARGDSGVAMNAAIASVSGCLSIVELNLLSFRASQWATQVRATRDALMRELVELRVKAQDRLVSQKAQSDRRAIFLGELEDIKKLARSDRFLVETEIEQIAIRLQRAIWLNKDLIWTNRDSVSHFEALSPELALKWYDFELERPSTLGQLVVNGIEVEVAGMIDQQDRLVSISSQFSPEVQHFTAAHELGHALFHRQQMMHRDRPLDGSVKRGQRTGEEWQADKFATYFLMPNKLVNEEFMARFLAGPFRITEETAFGLNMGTAEQLSRKCRTVRDLARLLAECTHFNGVPFESLSRRFGVSTKTMAIRLEELGLVALGGR